jgi:hypothetical protein
MHVIEDLLKRDKLVFRIDLAALVVDGHVWQGGKTNVFSLNSLQTILWRPVEIRGQVNKRQPAINSGNDEHRQSSRPMHVTPHVLHTSDLSVGANFPSKSSGILTMVLIARLSLSPRLYYRGDEATPAARGTCAPAV